MAEEANSYSIDTGVSERFTDASNMGASDVSGAIFVSR
jgi:hypothetical protein